MIETYEERLLIDDVLGTQDYGTIIRVNWSEETENECQRLVQLGELPEDYHEDDVLEYLGY